MLTLTCSGFSGAASSSSLVAFGSFSVTSVSCSGSGSASGSGSGSGSGSASGSGSGSSGPVSSVCFVLKNKNRLIWESFKLKIP